MIEASQRAVNLAIWRELYSHAVWVAGAAELLLHSAPAVDKSDELPHYHALQQLLDYLGPHQARRQQIEQLIIMQVGRYILAVEGSQPACQVDYYTRVED